MKFTVSDSPIEPKSFDSLMVLGGLLSEQYMEHEIVNLINGDRLSALEETVQRIKQSDRLTTDKHNVWELRPNNLEDFDALKVLSEEIRERLESRSKLSGLSLDKIWIQVTQPSEADQTVLPYITHFDKYRFLKGMLYLEDVGVKDGPIHFGKYAEHFKVDDVRRKLPFNHKELGLNLVKDRDLEEDPSPVVGKAGDVVLFDTSAPHKAGAVAHGHSRRVVRFDFEHRSFNSSLRRKDRLRKLISGSA